MLGGLRTSQDELRAVETVDEETKRTSDDIGNERFDFCDSLKTRKNTSVRGAPETVERVGVQPTETPLVKSEEKADDEY